MTRAAHLVLWAVWLDVLAAVTAWLAAMPPLACWLNGAG